MSSPLPIAETEISKDRYARLRGIEWWDQNRVAEACVLVAGAGAIGNEVIKLLALMGANNLIIVDFDCIEYSNLTRSVLFRDADIGKSKAEVAALRARELNPESRASGFSGDLEFDIGHGVYASADVVIGCLDSINARLALNRACLRAGVPWLNGGIEATFGEVSLYTGQSACFECTMSESMWDRRNNRYSCGGQRANLPSEAVPTTATMASIIAGYLVNEALLLLHASSTDQKAGLTPGQKVLLSVNPYGFHIVDQSRSPECTAHEEISDELVLAKGPEEISAFDILKLGHVETGALELGFDLLTAMDCLACGAHEAMYLPVEKSDASLTLCPQCGKDARQPLSISWIDANSICAHLPLSSLGVPN